MDRRSFLSVAALGAAQVGAGAAPRKLSANDKLNIALIGVWGRGLAHFDWLADENVVALCDCNEARFADGLARFPNAKTYVDWRKCLDHKGLDAIVCCTPDHTHAFIANWALNRDLHIYMEKPLAITVHEARTVRANWEKRKSRVATQVGMQRHAGENFNRVRELIIDGAIGELKSVASWGDRQIRRPGYLPAEGSVPSGLHWDLWLGPSPEHPYNPGYLAGRAGMNCLSWNMHWDFGAGQIGDMGSHTMDLVWNAIDAGLPTSAEAKGEPFNPEVTPVECESHFEHPANAYRGPIKVSWYQGGAMPANPRPSVDLKKVGHGALFTGTRGQLLADFTTRMLLPVGDDADLRYMRRRPDESRLPPVGHFMKQWVGACKGSGVRTACDFGYSADMIEQMLLGLVAYRAGGKLQYDPVAGKVTNNEAANAYLTKPYRPGWTLDG